jgi:hypothetical protein
LAHVAKANRHRSLCQLGRAQAGSCGTDEPAGMNEYRILDAAHRGKLGIPQARPGFR